MDQQHAGMITVHLHVVMVSNQVSFLNRHCAEKDENEIDRRTCLQC